MTIAATDFARALLREPPFDVLVGVLQTFDDQCHVLVDPDCPRCLRHPRVRGVDAVRLQ